MSEQETNTKNLDPNSLSAQEQFDLIKPFLDQGWSMTMSLAKAGISQRRNRPLFDLPEYKAIAIQRRKRVQFVMR